MTTQERARAQAGDNSLPALPARIKAEHKAVALALNEREVRHVIAAGEFLIEAKHGEWLPWLRDHCTISERTAQLNSAALYAGG
jgi:hypothetical protein